APQPRADDRGEVARRNASAREPLAESNEVAGHQPCLELGQCAERQAQHPLLAPDQRTDLAALNIGHQSTVKLSSPALSSAMSNVTAAAWSAENSSAVIWNGPSTVPKSGRISCQSRIVPAKNSSRILASDAWSLKIPEPETDARLMPPPLSNSRQRPALSASVVSIAAALNASARVRSPATVRKLPLPVSSSFKSMSLPLWAAMVSSVGFGEKRQRNRGAGPARAGIDRGVGPVVPAQRNRQRVAREVERRFDHAFGYRQRRLAARI